MESVQRRRSCLLLTAALSTVLSCSSMADGRRSAAEAQGPAPCVGTGVGANKPQECLTKTPVDVLLMRNLLEVFGERDGSRRRAAIRDLFAEDAVFPDPNGHYVGHEALERAIVALQARFPNFVFTARGKAQSLNEIGRLEWGFGPAGEAPRVTGVDVVVAKDGKIVVLYTFLDAPPGA
jgi:SnoaL-like domain